MGEGPWIERRFRKPGPELVQNLAAPHWNQAVSWLNEGGVDGYNRLITLLGRLGHHIAESQLRLAPLESKLLFLDRIGQAFSEEAERFGEGATVGDSIGEDLDAPGSCWWVWRKRRDFEYVIHARDDARDDLWMSEANAAVPTRTLTHDDSWADASNAVYFAMVRVEEQMAPFNLERSVAHFRYRIVDQVLKEWELLGIAEELDTNAASERAEAPITLEDVTFKEHLFAVAAKPILDAKPEVMCGGIFRAASVILTELKDESPRLLRNMGVSEDAMEERATRIRAYVRDEGGPGKRQDLEAPRRERLQKEVERMYRLLDGGKKMDPIYIGTVNRLKEITTDYLDRQ